MAEEILIVDDECEIADLVEVYLAKDGYSVHKFYTASDCLLYTSRSGSIGRSAMRHWR